MGCERFWPSERARDQQRIGAGATTICRRRTLARAHWIFWILFIGLQIADVVTTNYALAVPGNWEANPIMHLSQTHLGASWWLPKVAAVAFAPAVAPRTWRPWPILFAVSYYVIIVSGNLACL
jgi:hypothetical protein